MNTPNKITTCRLIIAVLMIVTFSLSYIPSSSTTWLKDITISSFNLGFNVVDLICFVLFILGSITDAVDGHIARSRGLITDLGKFLDPLADKFLVDSALILLCTQKDWYNHYQILPFITILFIGRDLAMDGLRMVSASKGVVLAANKWGKVKTALQMSIIPILFLNGFPFSLIPNELNMDSWLSNRFEYTYIITNILMSVALFFSLLSLGIYLYKNRLVLKGDKK